MDVRTRILTTERTDFDLRLLLDMALDAIDYPFEQDTVCKLWGVANVDGLKSLAATLDSGSLARLLLDCALVRNLEVSQRQAAASVHELLTSAASYYGLAEGAVATTVKAPAKRRQAASTPRPAAQAPEKLDAGAADGEPIDGAALALSKPLTNAKRPQKVRAGPKVIMSMETSEPPLTDADVDTRTRPLFSEGEPQTSDQDCVPPRQASLAETVFSVAGAWPCSFVGGDAQ